MKSVPSREKISGHFAGAADFDLIWDSIPRTRHPEYRRRELSFRKLFLHPKELPTTPTSLQSNYSISLVTCASQPLLGLANVKDEPRRELARRVPHSELDSLSSFRSTFRRTRRDSSRRWLWRLVSRLAFSHYERSSDYFGSIRWIYECHFHSGFSIADSTPRILTPRIFFSETRTHARDSPISPLSQHANRPELPVNFASRSLLLANVKDEPRRELARRVPHSELNSDSSFRNTFGRTRRDSSRRWLWRLVSPIGIWRGRTPLRNAGRNRYLGNLEGIPVIPRHR